MRYSATVCVVGFALTAMACGGMKVELPPVQPESVMLYYPGRMPDGNFKVLARLDETGPESMTDQELVDRVRARAADLGADALIIDTIRTTTEGQVNLDTNQPTEKIIEARAIYFPSKHPELMETSDK